MCLYVSVCVCVGEVGVGLVIIPEHVSLFVIHAMTSSALQPDCLGNHEAEINSETTGTRKHIKNTQTQKTHRSET